MQQSRNLNREPESENRWLQRVAEVKNGVRLRRLMFGVMVFVFCAFANKAMGQTWDIGNPGYNSNVKATLSGGTLTISGNGNMVDFWHSTEGEAPWWFPETDTRRNTITNAIRTVVFQSGSSITNIGERAFKDCKNLETIIIPSSVTKINGQAFFNCTSLQKLEIPNAVTAIAGEAFRGSGLNNLTIANGSSTLEFTDSRDNSGKYYNDWFTGCPISTLHLGRNYTYAGYTPPFSGMPYLQTLTIGSTVTGIGIEAFKDCGGLKNVTLDDGTTTLSIHSYSLDGYSTNAFNKCPISNLHIGRNLNESYRYDAPFGGKTTLTTLTIGKEVAEIGDNAFSGCTGLKSVTIGSNVTKIGSNAFASCGFTNIIIPDKVQSIEFNAFLECGELAEIIIPKSVTSIAYRAFKNCRKLRNITLEDGTTTLFIRAYTLDGYSDNAFNNCPINNLYMGRNLAESYQYEAPFGGKTTLTTLTIGKEVTTIGGSAFSGCTGLTQIHSQNPTPPIIGNGYYKCFDGVNKTTCKLNVPVGSENRYKEAFEWKEFFGISAIIPINADDIIIQSRSNGIAIETKEQMFVSIYNLSGRKVYESVIAGNTEIRLDKGMYIVKINNSSAKIIIP